MTQYVYFFGGGKADGHKDMKDTLGGKGSGLAEMTNAGVPVPPGFTITTQACNAFYDKGGLPKAVDEQMDAALAKLEQLQGKKLGDANDPLLVSVRSGAKFSMPGMMDTVLNLGLNDRSVEGLKKKTGNGKFAKDSYRRFIQMYGNVVMGIDKDAFEHELSAVKKKAKVEVRRGPHRGRPRRRHRPLQEGRAEGSRQGLPPGPPPAAGGQPRRGLRVLDEPPGHHLPQAQRHRPRPRHRGQRADHGLREHGRQLRHRRGLHPRPRDRRQRVLRRVPPERPGRGRGGRHPHPPPDRGPRRT